MGGWRFGLKHSWLSPKELPLFVCLYGFCFYFFQFGFSRVLKYSFLAPAPTLFPAEADRSPGGKAFRHSSPPGPSGLPNARGTAREETRDEGGERDESLSLFSWVSQAQADSVQREQKLAGVLPCGD